MILFKIDKEISLTFSSESETTFQQCVNLSKLFKLKWRPKEKIWIAPPSRFEQVLDAFSEIDIVQTVPENYKNKLYELLSPTRELEYKSDRTLFDYDLLSYPPVVGKKPFEDFQKIDIKNSIQRNRYGLFLDMGLGKSYILAAITSYYLSKNLVKKVLVISSNTGLRNLPLEFEKFIKDFPKYNSVIGNKDNRKPFEKEVDIVFTSYNSFRLISRAYQGKNKTEKPRKSFIPLQEWFGDGEGLILLDESHHVSNPNSQQSNFILIHAPLFKYRYLATGTPADKPEKLYSQCRILDPWLIHGFSFSEWKENYAVLGNRFSTTAITGWQQDKLEKLNKNLQEYSIFRKAEETIELPENRFMPVYCDLSKKHRKIYEKFTENTLENSKYDSGGFNVSKIVNLFPYLSLSLHNPSLLKKHEEKFDPELIRLIDSFNYQKDSDSFSALTEVIEDRDDEKGIIWVIHPDTASILQKELQKYNPIVITGKVKENERLELLNQFRFNEKHRILIANIDVLNTSYTIVEATWQFYLERHYNYTSYVQSQRRIWRLGQMSKVHTYYSVYKQTIDIFLDANLRNKGILTEKLTSREFLSKEEWKSIFNPSEILPTFEF